MNLITEPWIPILWSAEEHGSHALGLNDVFADAHKIRDLAVQPHERIALMRLLICIAQAALDGPRDRYDLDDCRNKIARSACEYLRKWQAQFELFGDGPRFLQVPNLKPGKADDRGNPATKLDLTLATGNNATVFDNAGGSNRPQIPARLALSLLTFQNFSPGGRIGVANWNGRETLGGGSSNHAPCIPSSMLHCYLQGETLLDTIRLNLLDREQVIELNGPNAWGKPIWEMPVVSLTATAEVRNATTTYLGRLIPLARSVRLRESGCQLILANGVDFPSYPEFREPAATLIQKKDGPGVLSASLERSLWRQLPAIVVRHRGSHELLCGPAALANLPDSSPACLWLGALVTDKAKIEDFVEAAYRVPAGMFQDQGRQVFEAGVGFADSSEKALIFSVKAYAATLKLTPPPYVKARQHFWTAIEQHVPVLLELTDTPAVASDFSATAWGRAVTNAAEDAYAFACPRLNARQIEAFAKGHQQLSYTRQQPRDGAGPRPITAEIKTTLKI